LQIPLQKQIKSLGGRKDATSLLMSSKTISQPLQKSYLVLSFKTIVKIIAKLFTTALQIYVKTIEDVY
jgi:hypothetical protein